MLVLARQRDEVIVIGDDGKIRITVLDIRGDKVRLGIEAPKDMPVHRLEVFNEIRQEQKSGVPSARRAGLAKSQSAEPGKPVSPPPRTDSYVERKHKEKNRNARGKDETP